jgi:3-phenylpropionate/trans-cinnamate dioxygenase ferredoxin subunit
MACTFGHLPETAPSGNGRFRRAAYDARVTEAVETARPLAYPPQLQAVGTEGRPFEPVLEIGDLPPGAMCRISRGDLDVLLAHTARGIVATDDRCPHMSAPLSIGVLDDCVVDCPLHEGRFDLATGRTVRMPTTGGLDAEGRYHPVWTPSGSAPKSDPPGKKTEARRLTRVRRLRYYPLRIRDGQIEVALPPLPAG